MTSSQPPLKEVSGVLYRKWESPLPKAVLLLVHGLGAHSGRWGALAEFFAQRGVSSYAIELKGFGETKGLKGHVSSFDAYLDDIAALHRIIKQENAGVKIFLLGESMGALAAFLTTAKRPDIFDGLICVSPAFKSRLKFGISGYLKIFALLLSNPKRQLSVPFDSAMCTRDINCQRTMDSDAREHRLATPRLLLNIALAGREAARLADRIRIPVLFLTAGQYDRLVDPDAAQKVFSRLTAQDKEIIRYPQMFHAISVDLDREKAFSDILDWVQKRI